MHSIATKNGALATVAAEAARRNGREAVVVWLPRPNRVGVPRCFDVYVCERLDDGSYKAHARTDTVCCEEHGFDRDGATWHAHVAGAAFRQFRQRVPHGAAVRGQARFELPCGRVVGAI